MNVQRPEVKIVAMAALLAWVVVLGGCAGGELEDKQAGGNGDNGDVNSSNVHNQEDPQNQGNQQNQGGDNDSENGDHAPKHGSSAHQICAAAGVSSDGQLESMYCFGPHDASGFEASDGDHTWQPGAFRIVAE